MVNPAQAIFNERPEAINGLGVRVSGNVDLLAVSNAAMLITTNTKAIVGSVVIGEDETTWHDLLAHKTDERICLGVLRDESPDAPHAFHHSHNRSLGKLVSG